jgi:hypothetical protein
VAKKASAARAGIVFADIKNIRYSPDAYGRNGYDLQWRPVFCSGYEIVDGQKVFHHFSGGEKCQCKPGPHMRAFKWVATARVDEMALPGGRGSGKSENSFGLMIAGDLASGGKAYIDNKFYRGLVLRENAKDLDNWISRADELYSKLGAKLTKSPTIKFVFPSGAEIMCDHLQNETAYRKYWGQEYARILIEECPQIASETLYKNVRKSCRVKEGVGLKAMMIVIGNPDGPGLAWFKNRFIKLQQPFKDADGVVRYRPLKSDEIWVNPLSGETRVFVHSTIYDNPYFLVGKADYLKQLEGEPNEIEKRRLLHGDFDALIGQYFGEFRPNGKMPGEPDRANHVVKRDSIRIEPWWPRLMGMDIGFRHYCAVIKGALAPNGQIIIYDEMVEAGVDNEDWGKRIGQWCKEELRGLPSHTMPLFLSHDAFGNRGEGHTQAEQIESGIKSILGDRSALLLNLAQDEGAEAEFFRALADAQPQSRIVMRKPFGRKRVDGWDFMRILMKWKSVDARPMDEMDQEYARQLLEREGMDALQKYMEQFDPKTDVALPRMLITDNCRFVIDGLQALVYDTDGTNPRDVMDAGTVDNDVADAVRYLCSGYQKYVEKLPKAVWIEQRVAMARESARPGSDLYQVYREAKEQYDEYEEPFGAFRFGVGSSRTQRVRVM